LVRLKDVVRKVGSGATPNGGEKVYLAARHRVALIRSQNVFDRHFSTEGLAFLTDRHADELSGAAVQPGDLLLNITGDGVTFGRSCMVPDHVLPACVNQHVSVIRPDPQKCCSGYLLCYLTHPIVKHYIESFNAGGSRRAVTKGHIESFEIPLPPLPVQESIRKLLGTLDDKIELNRRMNETLEAMARAIFKSWFVDFDPVRANAEGRQPEGMDTETAALFPDRFENSALGWIPKGWPVKPLPELIDVNPPRSLAKGTVAPYLDMANMPTSSARAVSWIDREFNSGTKFLNGDVLVARITPCLENGKTAFVDFLRDGQAGWGSTEYIVLRSKPPLPSEYVYFVARSDDFRSHAIVNMTGSSGRQRVPTSCLNSFLLVSPPPTLACRFGSFEKAAMDAMRQKDEESRTLAALRDALLPRLLSGEIRVTEADADVKVHTGGPQQL
jgi:type I restriction enzyme S subunit